MSAVADYQRLLDLRLVAQRLAALPPVNGIVYLRDNDGRSWVRPTSEDERHHWLDLVDEIEQVLWGVGVDV